MITRTPAVAETRRVAAHHVVNSIIIGHYHDTSIHVLIMPIVKRSETTQRLSSIEISTPL